MLPNTKMTYISRFLSTSITVDSLTLPETVGKGNQLEDMLGKAVLGATVRQ